MKIFTITLLFLLMGSAQAFDMPAEDEKHMYSGHRLLNDCRVMNIYADNELIKDFTDSDRIRFFTCITVLEIVISAMDSTDSKAWCKGDAFNISDFYTKFIKVLQSMKTKNKELLDVPAGRIIASSLKYMYPCNKDTVL